MLDWVACNLNGEESEYNSLLTQVFMSTESAKPPKNTREAEGRNRIPRREDDMAVGQKLEARQSTKGSDILILLVDPFLQSVQFDLASLLGQLARVDQVLVVRVQRLE